MANTPDKPHKKGPRKANKIGRNGRAAAHRRGQTCGKKRCYALMESRVWDRSLGAYVPRD